MYPRNAASPERIYIGAVIQISDGAVQTSGVSVTVTPFGGSETAGSGTVEYSTTGGVWYTPTQAETDATSFMVEASKTGCIPAGVTIVTKSTVELDAASTALLNDIPTTAEFEARTLAAASYATASQINSLQVNTRASVQVPVEIETPDSGTQVWKIRLFLFDSDGNMEAPDSTPTVALVNASGTDRSSRLSAATSLSTGAYSWDYTATDDDAEEQLNWTFTVVEGGLTRIYPATSYVVEETAYRFTSTDRSTLNSRASTSDVTTVGTAVTAVSTKLGTPAGASVSADIAAVKTDTGNLTTRITANLFSGITYMKNWMGLLAGKVADTATRAEINATTAGAGYNETTDSLQALRDQGDSGAWGGAASSAADLMVNTTIATRASQTVFTLTAGSPDNDAYNNQLVVITDQATATQKARAIVADYVGSTRTVTLKNTPSFEIAVGDGIAIIAVGAASQAVSLQLGATVPLTLGQVTGLTQDLVVGNSYTEELGTRIPVTLTDANGDPIAVEFNERSLEDVDCTIKCVLHPANSRNTDNVTAAAQGICEFVPATVDDPASLWIELPITETTRLSPGVYAIQFHAVWDDGEQVTLAWKGQCKFVRIVRPKS